MTTGVKTRSGVKTRYMGFYCGKQEYKHTGADVTTRRSKCEENKWCGKAEKLENIMTLLRRRRPAAGPRFGARQTRSNNACQIDA